MKKLLLIVITALSINVYAQWIPITNPIPACGALGPLEADGLNLFGGSFCNTGTDIHLSFDEGNS